MSVYRLCYLAAVGTGALVSLAVMHCWLGRDYLAPWSAAFLLTLAHGSLVFHVHARAFKEGHARFLYCGLGIHVARVVGILSLFLVLHVVQYTKLMPFIVSALIGYFCFLVFEVLGLQQGVRERERINE